MERTKKMMCQNEMELEIGIKLQYTIDFFLLTFFLETLYSVSVSKFANFLEYEDLQGEKKVRIFF